MTSILKKYEGKESEMIHKLEETYKGKFPPAACSKLDAEVDGATAGSRAGGSTTAFVPVSPIVAMLEGYAKPSLTMACKLFEIILVLLCSVVLCCTLLYCAVLCCTVIGRTTLTQYCLSTNSVLIQH